MQVTETMSDRDELVEKVIELTLSLPDAKSDKQGRKNVPKVIDLIEQRTHNDALNEAIEVIKSRLPDDIDRILVIKAIESKKVKL